jgi:hypothetical protein
MQPEALEQELQDALSRVRVSPSLRLLKIVHGYGSSGRGGSTKATVENWAYRERNRVRSVIAGESYGLFDETTRRMRAEVGHYQDADLDAGNRGITLVWVK